MITINKNKFTEWLQAKQLSPRTIIEYVRYLDNELCLYQDLNFEDITLFLGVYNNSISRAFIKNLLSYVQTSGLFTIEDETKAMKIFINLPKISGHKKTKVKEVLSYDEVILLANSPEMKGVYRILCLITFTCGLRISELLSLKYCNVNFKSWLKNTSQNGRAKIIGKGNKEAIINIFPELMGYMINYINLSGSRPDNDKNKIFKISKNTWQTHLKKSSLKIFNKHITPHTLRRSFATYLLNSGFNLMEVKDALRHADISTTQSYLILDKNAIQKKLSEVFNKSLK